MTYRTKVIFFTITQTSFDLKVFTRQPLNDTAGAKSDGTYHSRLPENILKTYNICIAAYY